MAVVAPAGMRASVQVRPRSSSAVSIAGTPRSLETVADFSIESNPTMNHDPSIRNDSLS